VLSDHYPSLSFQVRQFLKHESDKRIQPPFVMDVFTIDAVTEMLDSPLQFLSYVKRRTNYSDRLMSPDELTILSLHLKQNLWLDDRYDFVQLHDDISTHLDAAMTVRRDGIPGKRTPDGILTRLAGTTLWRIVGDIERSADPQTVDFGSMLLEMDEDSFRRISTAIDEAVRKTRQDGRNRDFSTGCTDNSTGITVHFNADPIPEAIARMKGHTKIRKYVAKAKKWFGVCIDPTTVKIRFGVNLEFDWEQSPSMDEEAREFELRNSLKSASLVDHRGEKVGRNDPCPCGSGKKHKKCCGH
jgi:hypothetical protein